MVKIERTINIVEGMKLIVEMDTDVTAEQVLAENNIINKILKIKEGINKELEYDSDIGEYKPVEEVRTKRPYHMVNRVKKDTGRWWDKLSEENIVSIITRYKTAQTPEHRKILADNYGITNTQLISFVDYQSRKRNITNDFSQTIKKGRRTSVKEKKDFIKKYDSMNREQRKRYVIEHGMTSRQLSDKAKNAKNYLRTRGLI